MLINANAVCLLVVPYDRRRAARSAEVTATLGCQALKQDSAHHSLMISCAVVATSEVRFASVPRTEDEPSQHRNYHKGVSKWMESSKRPR